MDILNGKTSWDVVNLLFGGFGVTVVILLYRLIERAGKRIERVSHGSIFTKYSNYGFRHPRPEELNATYDFAVQLVGNTLAERRVWISRFEAFPDCLYLLESGGNDDGHAELCGLFTAIPLTSSACKRMDSKGLDATLLKNSDIDPISPAGVYLSILAANSRIEAALLMRKLKDTLEEPRYKQLPVYARPVHSPAFPLMSKYGFKRVGSPGAITTSPLTVYKLDRG